MLLLIRIYFNLEAGTRMYKFNVLDYGDLDKEKMVSDLSEMLKFKTISYKDYTKFDYDEFIKLREYIEKSFPLVHQKLERKIINGYSLLYRWKGKTDKKPILFMAHMDVVPITTGTENDWTYPPFSGEIADGFIWGRGATDLKCMVCAELTAVEYLLGKGFEPDRDIYLAFGHDEEVNGVYGAQKIADYCVENGIHFDFVLDEGGSFEKGKNYGVPEIVFAKVGIFEKGHLNLKLTAKGRGGHSSTPPAGTSLGEIAKAICAIEKNKLKADMSEPLAIMLKAMAPYMKKKTTRLFYSNPRLFKWFIINKMKKNAVGDALIRTTTAVTQASGSTASKVLPIESTAVVNFRLNPVDTCRSVMEHCKKVIKNPNITYEMFTEREASKVSKVDSPQFEAIKKTISEVYPNTVAIPSVVLGGTDSRKFEPVCDYIYRFLPFITLMDLYRTMHSTDERIPVEGIENAVVFLAQLIKNYCQ